MGRGAESTQHMPRATSAVSEQSHHGNASSHLTNDISMKYESSGVKSSVSNCSTEELAEAPSVITENSSW